MDKLLASQIIKANARLDEVMSSGSDASYTAGDGIDITSGEISAKIGEGLEFDANGAIKKSAEWVKVETVSTYTLTEYLYIQKYSNLENKRIKIKYPLINLEDRNIISMAEIIIETKDFEANTNNRILINNLFEVTTNSYAGYIILIKSETFFSIEFAFGFTVSEPNQELFAFEVFEEVTNE